MKLRMTVILLAVALLPAGYMLGKSSILTEFTGADSFVRILPGGTVNCPGGQLNTHPFNPSPCTPGSRVHARDSKFEYHFQSTDARMTGRMELTANGNYDGWRTDLQGPGSGQMWGTMRVEVEGHPDELWEGTWTGTRTVTDTGVVITTQNVLFGTGGSIQGLKAKFSGRGDPVKGGALQGWILAPLGKACE